MFNFALITAAGKGVRLRPLTEYVPKAMVQVNGTTLISRLIRQLKPDINNITITVGHLGNLLATHVIEEEVSAIYNTNHHSECWWIFNTPMRFLNEPVIVFTCDLVLELDLAFIDRSYRQLGEPVCMMVPIPAVPQVEGHFIVDGDDGLVRSFSKKPVSGLLASGIYVINPWKVNQLMEEPPNLEILWQRLAENDQLCRSPLYLEAWSTVNTVEQLEMIKPAS